MKRLLIKVKRRLIFIEVEGRFEHLGTYITPFLNISAYSS